MESLFAGSSGAISRASISAETLLSDPKCFFSSSSWRARWGPHTLSSCPMTHHLKNFGTATQVPNRALFSRLQAPNKNSLLSHFRWWVGARIGSSASLAIVSSLSDAAPAEYRRTSDEQHKIEFKFIACCLVGFFPFSFVPCRRENRRDMGVARSSRRCCRRFQKLWKFEIADVGLKIPPLRCLLYKTTHPHPKKYIYIYSNN